jgi:hypothetical protein
MSKGRPLVFTLHFFQSAAMETLGLTPKIMAKMPKIACNWSGWARLCSRGTQKIYKDVSSLRVSGREFVVFALGGKMVRPICIVLLSLLLEGCTKASVQEPVTLTFLEEW